LSEAFHKLHGFLREERDDLKNLNIKWYIWKEFVKDLAQAKNWNKGMPTLAFKNKWRDILFILQKYVTCEGKYGIYFYYHLQLLIHFIKCRELNMSFYLLKSLKNMALIIQHSTKSLERSLFHFGLVKILVEAILQEKNNNWVQFLVRNNFVEALA
jgi:hypothetical protein